MNSDVLRAASDRTAPYYDERFGDLQRAKYELALSRLDSPLGAGLLLDLGCGTGLLAEHLGRTLIGVDLSSQMLARAVGRGERVAAPA